MSLRQFYRVLALVGVVGVTVFTWIHRAASPAAVDPVWQRVVVGGACAVLLAGTWRLDGRRLERLANGVFYLLTLWVLELLILNRFDQNYALAYVVVTAGIAGTYRNRQRLVIYQGVTLAGIALAAAVVVAPDVNLLVYIAYSVVMSILVYVAVGARLDLDLRRADSEVRYAAATERLTHEATHDAVTGLPNRTLMLDRLGRLLASARRRPDSRFALLVIDLDRFGRINDTLGPQLADQLLREVAARLQSALREEDTLARVGTDEFGVVVPSRVDLDDVLRLADRLGEAVSAPLELGSEPVHVSVSVGVTLGPNGYHEPGELLRDAYLAVHRSKQARPNRPQLFDEAMHTQAVQQLRLEADLRRALEDGHLQLHYQPIIDLASGSLHGFEALVRWQHPEHGMLLPDQFLPLAEETGLIIDIGRWALLEACAAQSRWTLHRQDVPRVHVNLSAAHFSAGTLVQDVGAALGATPQAPKIGVEITESTLLHEPESAATILRELRERDVRVAIDDFGTGYSSLRYLHSLPADVLKIDRTFVSRSPERSGIELIRSMVMLADRLGLATVAEGIETEQHAQLLRDAGATYAQGYLYSAAVPEREMAAVMSRV